MYAKYISETTINTVIPKYGHDAQGRLVTGDLTNRPDVLALLDYFPMVEQEMPSDTIEGYHYEKRYAPPDGGEIAQSWVSVEDPPEPPPSTRVYSKLKILMAADEAGLADVLMDTIESDRKLKYIWDASNTVEDNAILKAYMPQVASALSKTADEVYAFLDAHCAAD